MLYMTRHSHSIPIRVIHFGLFTAVHGPCMRRWHLAMHCSPPPSRLQHSSRHFSALPYSKRTNMIFEPAERLPLPTKDLLSYMFDNPPYDQDEPVCGAAHCGRIELTFCSELDLHRSRKSIPFHFLQPGQEADSPACRGPTIMGCPERRLCRPSLLQRCRNWTTWHWHITKC